MGQMTLLGTGKPPAAAAAWQPSDNPPDFWARIDGTNELYQDTGTATPATADNDPVGHLLDHSGNGRHFERFSAGLKPLFKTGAHPYLLHDATNDSLQASVAATYALLNN